jgi:hypothetical protein
VRTDLISPLLFGLLDCAVASLDPVPARAIVNPGEVAWDECCEGQVWTRLVSIVPSGVPFPATDTAQQCGVLMWAATVGLGVLRCAAVQDDQGNPPSASAISATGLQQAMDAQALMDALSCCWPPLAQRRAKIATWTPLGPAGGCVGGEWTVQVMVDNCRCPVVEPVPVQTEEEPDAPTQEEG